MAVEGRHQLRTGGGQVVLDGLELLGNGAGDLLDVDRGDGILGLAARALGLLHHHLHGAEAVASATHHGHQVMHATGGLGQAARRIVLGEGARLQRLGLDREADRGGPGLVHLRCHRTGGFQRRDQVGDAVAQHRAVGEGARPLELLRDRLDHLGGHGKVAEGIDVILVLGLVLEALAEVIIVQGEHRFEQFPGDGQLLHHALTKIIDVRFQAHDALGGGGERRIITPL